MRNHIQSAVALAFLVGSTVTALAADDDPPPRPTYRPGTWMGSNNERPEPKPPVKEKKEPAPIPKISPIDLAAQKAEAEMNTYFRRQQACDRLAILALQSGDAEQIRRVEELKERVFSVYKKRVASLPISQGTGRSGETMNELGTPVDGRGTSKGGAK